MAESGSPIIVDGGGSIKIRFNHKAYDKPCGGDVHNHGNAKAQIARVLIDGREAPCRPNSKIEIHLEEPSS